MTEPKWKSDPREQEPLVRRHPYRNDPTRVEEERTADEQSTTRNGGVGSGGDRRDPIMPADDSTLRTDI
jgi:hypothetical protein